MKPLQTEERSVSSLIGKQLTEEEFDSVRGAVSDYHHKIDPKSNQCCSALVRRVSAPLELVWSLVRRFDKPQTYKHFVRSCHVQQQQQQNEQQNREGAIAVGSIRHVDVVSGLPAASSTERLEMLDDQRHVISFSILGGQHRLRNYRSTTSLHELRRPPGASAASRTDGRAAACTLVIESYVVDVPRGNTREDTSLFVDTIVKCNLQTLCRVSERLAAVAGTASQRSLPNSPGPRKGRCAS